MNKVITKTCPSCNQTFSCSNGECWCIEFPTILKLEETGKCLCESCLKGVMITEIKRYLEHITLDKIKEVQALGAPTKFIKGIDYEINENGAWVFSSWYLMRQGGCCGNGCKNCPYPPELKK
ncbi:MAG: hypothetical protein JXR03_09995 [Cyclobacteriaceae bacterium]